MENQAELYYEKLKNAENVGQVLTEFYVEITGREGGRTAIIMINKLVRMFGRFIVYFSILDVSRYEKIDGDVYPLLFTICRSRFEKTHPDASITAHAPLERQINQIRREIEKNKEKKVKIPDSEGLLNG